MSLMVYLLDILLSSKFVVLFMLYQFIYYFFYSFRFFYFEKHFKNVKSTWRPICFSFLFLKTKLNELVAFYIRWHVFGLFNLFYTFKGILFYFCSYPGFFWPIYLRQFSFHSKRLLSIQCCGLPRGSTLETLKLHSQRDMNHSFLPSNLSLVGR